MLYEVITDIYVVQDIKNTYLTNLLESILQNYPELTISYNFV